MFCHRPLLLVIFMFLKLLFQTFNQFDFATRTQGVQVTDKQEQCLCQKRPCGCKLLYILDLPKLLWLWRFTCLPSWQSVRITVVVCVSSGFEPNSTDQLWVVFSVLTAQKWVGTMTYSLKLRILGLLFFRKL